MTQYIDKAALVAEIERLIEIANNNYAKFFGNRSAWAQQRGVCEKLLSFIDTIEEKEEPVSKDLGKYINELSQQFPEVSFAKLSRIAVRVANWQKEQIMKDAIEREVKEDAGGYPYIDATELYDYDKEIPLAKKGDKVNVIIMTRE